MATKQIGLYTIIVLLILKVAILLFEEWVIISSSKRKTDRQTARRKLRASACILAMFTTVCGGIALSLFTYSKPSHFEQCGKADADIVGIGVRAATWLQQGFLFIMVLGGMYHFNDTAVKELGAGLLVAHISLAIALMVPLSRQELSFVDAILGSMILDGQNLALSIQLSTKETLAARWQVWTVILGQLTGLIAIAVLLDSFRRNALVSNKCQCFPVFWWAWFSNCGSVSPNDTSPFWIYYALRWISTLNSSRIALRKMGKFDKAKKMDDLLPFPTCSNCARSQQNAARGGVEANQDCCKCKICPRLKEHCQTCRTASQQRCGHDMHACGEKISLLDGNGLINNEVYSGLPATVSLSYMEHGILMFLSFLTTQTMMANFAISTTSRWYAVGQVANLVIACGTAFRCIWVFAFTCIKKE